MYRLKVIGAYGLKNKREVWRVQFTLAKIRYDYKHSIVPHSYRVYLLFVERPPEIF